MTQLTIDQALTARDEAMASVAKNAGALFRESARTFVLDYLREHGATPGEVLTDACESAGIVAHDSRAFGPVYMSLSRQGLIEKCGTVARTRGHGTAGGNVWRLVAHE